MSRFSFFIITKSGFEEVIVRQGRDLNPKAPKGTGSLVASQSQLLRF